MDGAFNNAFHGHERLKIKEVINMPKPLPHERRYWREEPAHSEILDAIENGFEQIFEAIEDIKRRLK